jgi:hypothetical protein
VVGRLAGELVSEPREQSGEVVVPLG